MQGPPAHCTSAPSDRTTLPPGHITRSTMLPSAVVYASGPEGVITSVDPFLICAEENSVATRNSTAGPAGASVVLPGLGTNGGVNVCTSGTSGTTVTSGDVVTPGTIVTSGDVVTSGAVVTSGDLVTSGAVVTPGTIVASGAVVTSGASVATAGDNVLRTEGANVVAAPGDGTRVRGTC